MAAHSKERKNEMKTNTKKTDILNRIGQMIRDNKLVVRLLVGIAVAASIGIGVEYSDRAMRKRNVAARRTARTLSENGNPYAVGTWGMPTQNGQVNDFEQRMAQARAIGRQLARNQIAGIMAGAPKWLQSELIPWDLPPEVRAGMLARRRESAADGRRTAEIYAQQCKWNQQYYDQQREIALNSLPSPVPRADRNLANQLGLKQVYPSGFYGLSKDNTLYEDSHGNRYRVSGGSARKLLE